MGDLLVPMLAIAASCVFGVGGVVLGIWLGVRSVTRDEARFQFVADSLELVRKEQSGLKLEWASTLEQLEQLAAAVEKGRRRAAASLSAAERKEQRQAEDQPVQMSPQDIRNQLRRQIPRLGVRR